MEQSPPKPHHRLRNTRHVMEQADAHFALAYRLQVMGVLGKSLAGRHVRLGKATARGDDVVDFVRCSYLGLDNHPAIVRGALDAIAEYQAVHWSCARTRLNFELLGALEAELSEVFTSRVVAFSSVMLANLGALPLLAAGCFTEGVRPVMAFDRLCHASLAYHKPVAAAETEVVTVGHNDLAALEELCRSRRCVAYIADGVYSMGGAAPIRELLALQERYNLFLYLDDAHGVSVFGTQGEGFVRSRLPAEMGARCMVALSLGKGFGASGGVLLLGCEEHEQILRRYAQPYAFSAAPNLAAVGAAQASAGIHRSRELSALQHLLKERIDAFDRRIHSPTTGSPVPIRIVPLGNEEEAILAARLLLEGGVYVSAVFFPTVGQGAAGLRICLTAAHAAEDIEKLCRLIDRVNEWRAFDPPSQPGELAS